MTRILLVGYDPETVDFSDPALPPGMTVEKIHAGIAVAMKQFLVTLGLLILVTAIKAVAWIGQNGAPPSLVPATVGDWVGLCFVVVLLVTFVSCLIWYLWRGVRSRREESAADSKAG